MPPISNLNVQIGPNQTGAGEIGTAPAPGRPVPPSPLSSLRTGTVVEGQVLGRNADGTYSVRLDAQDGRPAQTLLARATLTLIVGERFRAVWDASGPDGVPSCGSPRRSSPSCPGSPSPTARWRRRFWHAACRSRTRCCPRSGTPGDV